MLKIALCNDSQEDVSRYAGFIKAIAKKHQMQIDLCCFSKGAALLNRYENKLEELDIVYI